MLPYRYNKLTIGLVGLLFAAALGYSYFEGRHLLQGPVIALDIPGTMTVTEPYLRIAGTAERIVELQLNGRPVSVTEAGAFTEDIVLMPGYNRVSFTARDRTGRATVKDLEVLYQATTTSPVADQLPIPLTPTP
ncbi:MAG: hypothetical protein KBE09_02295 [Candidatus Pacebacteria bacterium]|nr:hypothetical protein [Candidatus Paceibacterota bacterium]